MQNEGGHKTHFQVYIASVPFLLKAWVKIIGIITAADEKNSVDWFSMHSDKMIFKDMKMSRE